MSAIKTKDANLLPFFYLASAVLLIWGWSWYYIVKWYGYAGGAGQFGDQFGAVNSLFSGLAFAGVVYAILLQRRELALQREELEQTRNELKGQKEELAKRNESAAHAQFENTFFGMIRELRDLSESIEYSDCRGGDAFGLLVKHAVGDMISNKESSWHDAKDKRAFMRDHYDKVYRRTQFYTGHYFRLLYHIIKLVDDRVMDESKKRFYVNLVRAQLSVYELRLLFLNCLGTAGKGCRPLIEKYTLFKHLDSDFAGAWGDNGLYPPRAFNKEKT